MITKYKTCFADRMPKTLEPGILYVSMECNVVIHLCPCGCNEKVVLPIAPEHWQIKYDGEGVTIYPSVGNTYFDCRSHYYIRDSKVFWLENMDKPSAEITKKKNFLERLKSWLRRHK